MTAIICIATILFSAGYTLLHGSRRLRLASSIPAIAWLAAECVPFLFPVAIGLPFVLIMKIGGTALAIRLFQTARLERMIRISQE